jgi:TPR repeat protein
VSSAYSLDIKSEINSVSQNQTEAEKYYKLSLKAYENKDNIQAIELAKLSYGYGSVESAVILGEIFRKSNPSIRSFKESKKWYLLAANANNSEALMALGEMALLKQAGLTINDALIYLTKASDMGHTDAMVALSEIYLKGIGVDIDKTAIA